MRWIATSAAGLALIVSGCSNSTESTSNPQDATFTLAVNADLGPFDPHQSLLIIGYMHLAYDSLVNLDDQGDIVSGLASEWEADATTQTFTLRDDVTCSDGTKMTPSLVKKTLDYVKDPANQSPLSGTLTPTTPFKVTADDAAGTVTVEMEQPFGFALQTIGLIPVVCPAGMKDRSILSPGSEGTGPYVLTEFAAGDHYTFSVREDYAWGPDGATANDLPGTVVLRVVENEGTAANLLLNGEVQAAGITGQDAERLEAEGLEAVENYAVEGELWFNQRDDRKAADPALRRALVTALDLDELANVSTSGRGRRSDGLVAMEPGQCTGDTVAGQLPEHDPDAAATLLDEAGWTPGPDGVRVKDGERLEIILRYAVWQAPNTANAMELVAQQWEAVGVKTELLPTSLPELSEVIFDNSDWDAYWNGWNVNLPSILTPFLSGPEPPDGQNFSGINNSDYEALVGQAMTQTGEKACEFWTEAEGALFTNLDVVPVSDLLTPVYLNGSTYQSNGLGVVPTSIRLAD